MKSLFFALLLGSNIAMAYEYAYETEVARLKCDGTMDNFIVTYTASIDTKNLKIVSSKVDLAYKVQVWTSQPNTDYQMDDVVVNRDYVQLEGTLGAGSDKYTVEYPKWNWTSTSKSTSFYSKLKLEAGLARGNVELDCQAYLTKAKTKTQY